MKNFQYRMTIIVPSYNNGQYIRQALDSILMQEVDFNYQIIITDDCSQDDSPEIIREYEKKYPEKVLALYSAENCRLFRNVLKALEKMDSEYFCVLDPDDYWSDRDWMQDAVNFLDTNKDYTIYGANAYKLFNDGSVELKFDRPGMSIYSSTYEDYIEGKDILSTTVASVYRNVYFSDGIPQEYLNLCGTQFEEISRADSFRNLLHIKRGKAYFINKCIGYYRCHGKGLASAMPEYERSIISAFAYIGFWEFFGKEHETEYAELVIKYYKEAVKKFMLELVLGRFPKMSGQYKSYLNIVLEWLQAHYVTDERERIPFSLKKFGELWSKTVFIWGTGSGACKLIDEYGIPIGDNTFFVDNSPKKQGKEFMGRLIKGPESIKSAEDCCVVIASSYYKEIIEQIREQKLCKDDRIVNLYDYKENWIG